MQTIQLLGDSRQAIAKMNRELQHHNKSRENAESVLVASRENNLTSSNHLATHVQQLLHVLIHHRLGLLVELVEQAGAEDLLVGHRCPEDAQGIAQDLA